MSAAEVRALLPNVFSRYAKVTSIRNPFAKCVSAFYWKLRRDAVVQAADADAQIAHFRRRLETDDITPSDRNKYVLDDGLIVDHVVCYERLAADVQALCDLFGTGWDAAGLEMAKGRYRNRAIAIARFFDARAVDVVLEKFDFEFDCFGYSRDPADIDREPASIRMTLCAPTTALRARGARQLVSVASESGTTG